MHLRRTLHQRLAAAASRDPGRVVLVDGRTTMCYRDLLAAADSRAAALLNSCEPGDRVGVLLECSAATVVTYYACLRAGVLYTPIPPYPDDVLVDLVRRLGLRVLVTDRSLEVPVPRLGGEAAAVRPEGFPHVLPSAAAHVLLTSGTTSGVPKTVLTDQIGSVLSHDWRSGLYPYQDDDVVGCNIFGIWDVVPALEHAVAAVMIDEATLRDPLSLAGAVVRHGITRLMLTPSLLGACLASPAAVAGLKRLRLIVLCGEIARPAVLRAAQQRLPDTRLLDLYSVAECHDVAAGFVRNGESRLRPAPYAEVRVVDRDDGDRPVGAGETGRVLVGGPGLALGYDGEVPGRFFERSGRRFYDTGDLAVLHASGEITVVGRADARVKIRGRWVDPAEVERVLAGHPEVADVKVRAADGRVRATVVGQGRGLVPRLRAYAARGLPAYAVPDRIDLADALHVGPSGKAQAGAATPRRGRLEGVVVDAFRRVLDDPAIGPDDSFGDLGVNSVDAITLCGRLEDVTGRPVSVADLYRCARPREVAALIDRTAKAEADHWALTADVPPVTRPAILQPWRRPLVTGATGHLGKAVMAALGPAGVACTRPHMDIDQPRLGLSQHAFHVLADQVDGVIHTAARVDPFADFASLYRTNVCGTAELVRLAGIRGVPFCHVSSSAVFPLGSRGVWTPDAEPAEILAGPLRNSGADAYSYTKLGAEIVLWRAADKGLPVRLVRVPHVLGHPARDRLLRTLAALEAAGVYPEGAWQWQFVTRDLVVQALTAPLDSPRAIRHVALPPVAVRDLVEYLGLDLVPVPMAAIATALDRVGPDHPHGVDARVLRRLVAEHGPVAALSMNDAILSHGGGDALEAFAAVFPASA